MNSIIIDPEFQNLIPPLSDDERAGLEASIKAEGCRDALVVWSSGNVLLDGHTRYAICQRLGVKYETATRNLPDRAAARLWIIRNQLSRRNLTPEQTSYLRGAEYLALRKPQGGDHKTSKGKSCTLIVADELAASHGVSPRTIKNDAAFTLAVDALDVGVHRGIKARVLAGEGPSRAAIIEAAEIVHEEPRRAARLLAGDERRIAHVSHNSGDNEWYTPAEYIEAARQVMEGIDLDPASSAAANKVVKASRFYSAADDGLARDWAGRVFLNPPYAQPLVQQFCAKLAGHVRAGDVLQAVVLVNNATDATWFHRLLDVAVAICLIRRRVRFLDPQGGKPGSPLQGQIALYVGPKEAEFGKEFARFGVICHVVR